MLRTRTILERLYPTGEWRDRAVGSDGAARPVDLVPRVPWRLRLQRLRAIAGSRSLADWMRRNWKLGLVGVALAAYGAAHVHYYNLLIELEFGVQQQWAQVETQLQRRHHIQQNLARIAGGYSAHERDVLIRLTEIRGAEALDGDSPPLGEGETPPAGVESGSRPIGGDAAGDLPLGGIPSFQVVAEQYPALQLSQNLQQFSSAVIEAEDRIAAQTVAYNDAVNRYSTTLSQFPTNIFAWLCGFESVDYHEPDEEALRFIRVDY